MLPSLSFAPSASRDEPKLPLGIDRGELKTRNWSMLNNPLQNPSTEIRISSPPKTPPNPADIKIPSNIGSECHSSYRVPLVLPMTEALHQKVEEIDNGLSGVNKASLTPEDKQSRNPSNNKENRSTSNKEIPMHCTHFCRQPTRSPTSHRLDTRKFLPDSSHLYQSEKP